MPGNPNLMSEQHCIDGLAGAPFTKRTGIIPICVDLLVLPRTYSTGSILPSSAAFCCALHGNSNEITAISALLDLKGATVTARNFLELISMTLSSLV